ncbi:DUF7830 domain-containing protein [Geomesophilobacter sediminis]
MAAALQCRFFGHIIDVEKALAVRAAALPKHRRDLRFECVKCGKPVGPRAAGERHSAHFVHLQANPDCPITDPRLDF